MPIELAAVFGFVQAITEFLPVSSSGHLVLIEVLLGSDGKSGNLLPFFVLVHFATLLATVAYLKDDLIGLFKRLLEEGERTEKAWRLVFLLVVASIPSAVVGIGFKSTIEAAFSSINATSVGFLLTSVFLFMAHYHQHRRTAEESDVDEDLAALNWELPTLLQAILIGLAQSIAILPGVSRSGSTIATGLSLGLSVNAAVRFSFMLSLPTIFGATLLQSGALVQISGAEALAYAGGFIVALSTGWWAIQLLVHVARSAKLAYFGVYTLLLALLLLVN